MVIAVVVLLLAGCPDEKPIDLSAAKTSHREMPAARAPVPKPRPTMPDAPLPVKLPTADGPTLAYAPELVIFDTTILRKATSSTDPYAGTPVPYVKPTSLAPVGVAGRLDDAAGSIALFVNRTSSAVDTLYLLDDLKLSQVAMATWTGARYAQLRYLFGAADASVRDRLQIDVTEDEITIGEQSFVAAHGIAPAIAELRKSSTIGIEARIGVRSGTTNDRMVAVLDVLAGAKVEAVYLYPVQDSTVHSSTAYADSNRGIPRVMIGQPNAQGDLDKAIIRRYIKRNIQRITYCYEKELLATPDLSGTVSTQFFIRPDGKVAQAAASGVSPRVASCVAGVIRNIEFPKPKGGGGVQVNYPFTMRPSGG